MGAEQVDIYDPPNLDKISEILCPEYLSEIVYIDFFVRYTTSENYQHDIEKSEIICN